MIYADHAYNALPLIVKIHQAVRIYDDFPNAGMNIFRDYAPHLRVLSQPPCLMPNTLDHDFGCRWRIGRDVIMSAPKLLLTQR